MRLKIVITSFELPPKKDLAHVYVETLCFKAQAIIAASENACNA
jgi:hypothetical protein